ncbi:MAG: ATP-binding cassette domain-containing protein [Chloroflexi bacterium]|nr:ATP-binding cassette domain-containing protein [Chloroflexota bacterium]
MTPAEKAGADAILEIQDLRLHFPIKAGLLKKTVGYVKAVDGVSFDVYAGETVGLVGESGSGKTTIGRCIVRLYKPTTGSMHFRTEAGPVDIAQLDKRELLPIRRDIQMLFQDPNSSLNARIRVGDIIAEPLEIHAIGTADERRSRVEDLLEQVGLGAEMFNRFPHQLSGGQRQRVGVARALSIEPRFVICDEPVSALDVSVQAQVLNLLADLQEELGLTYVFIAHDLSVVEYISDRVMVMYLGKLMETAPTRKIFEKPAHPYTEALLNSIPKRAPGGHRKRFVLTGDIPSPVNPPAGCVFHTRCQYAVEICRTETPPLKPLPEDPETSVACHLAEEVTLQPYYTAEERRNLESSRA